MLPSLTVECCNGACPQVGKRRRVHLRTAAPGVLEMPRLVCAGCGFDMPAVTPWPPVTESEDETMPKITVHGGPSHAVDIPAEPEVEETGEEEQPSAGSSSETSSEKSDSSPKTSEPAPQKPARTTASRSTRARTGSSSARSTDGGQTEASSAPDGDK